MTDTPNPASPPSAGADEASAAMATDIDPRLLEILVCPTTKTTLRFDRERMELISLAAGVAYPIRDGVPIMLADEVRPLTETEIARLKAKA